jgi:hypothetical protein
MITDRLPQSARSNIGLVAAGTVSLYTSVRHRSRVLVDAVAEDARPLLHAAAGRLGAWRRTAGEHLDSWLRAAGLERLARHPRVLEARAWARTFGLGHRPVQIVGAAMVAGLVYLSVSEPTARPVTEADEAVVARVAPVGAITLAHVDGSQLAERSVRDRSPSTSVN